MGGNRDRASWRAHSSDEISRDLGDAVEFRRRKRRTRLRVRNIATILSWNWNWSLA